MIPFYKEVVLMSFECAHCGHRNNEIQSGAEIAERGCRIELTVRTVADLNRKVVKSDHTAVRIVELDFEIPAGSQRGEITTVEGVLDRACAGLEQDQPVRRVEHPEDAQQIDAFVEQLRELKLVERPWTIILDDVAGNCFVENPNAPHVDGACIWTHYQRTVEQDHTCGVYTQKELRDNEAAGGDDEKKQMAGVAEEDEDAESSAVASGSNADDGTLHKIADGSWPLQELHGEVLQFETVCASCKAPCQTNMKVTSIPHFKDVVIMATCCDVCGVRTNEVKSGGGIEPLGVRFEVRVADREDMSRDVLKSDNCQVAIPELDCEVGAAALNGRFTTVEGLLEAIKLQLSESGNMFRDSDDKEARERMDAFIAKLDSVVSGAMPVTLVLDDPSGNSYVQALTDDGTLDERLKISKYVRTYDQDEELGINDMRTEDYGAGAEDGGA